MANLGTFTTWELAGADAGVAAATLAANDTITIADVVYTYDATDTKWVIGDGSGGKNALLAARTAAAGVGVPSEAIRTDTTDPTTRSDGTALQAGDFYYNTVDENLYVYDGTAWAAVGGSSGGGAEFSGINREYTTSQTFSPPYSGNVVFFLWGGGGGGAANNSVAANGFPSGGRGGDLVVSDSISVTTTDSFTVTLGAGGTGGTMTDGNDGTVSTLVGGGLNMTAQGGGAGLAFGNGSNPDVGTNSGGAGYENSSKTPGWHLSGADSFIYFNNGNGGSDTDAAGSNNVTAGSGSGGGGGGSCRSGSNPSGLRGGNGGNGRLVIFYI